MADKTMLQKRAIAKLKAAMVYWVATASKDGVPHAAPVWGVWLDDGFWFGTTGQKVRNMDSNPQAVVHLDSGDDVVIVRGRVETVKNRAMLQRVAKAYSAKYVDGEKGDPFDPLPTIGLEGHFYHVIPETGWAWLEGDFVASNTRWAF